MQSNSLRARARRWWREEIRPFLILALVLCSIRSSIADWNDVPTGSMKPVILEGDRVFVNKLAYDLKVPFTTVRLAQWEEPRRGEIVVFYSPVDEKRWVKRVIAVPGDVVELRHNCLFLNGQAVEYAPVRDELLRYSSTNDRAAHQYALENLPGHSHPVAANGRASALRDFGPYRVPEGKYFLMGDNRDESFDCRYFGPVERRRILGRATAVALSFDRENYWRPRFGRFFRALIGA